MVSVFALISPATKPLFNVEKSVRYEKTKSCKANIFDKRKSNRKLKSERRRGLFLKEKGANQIIGKKLNNKKTKKV